MKNKKILSALLLSALLIPSLIACSNSDSTNNSGNNTDTSASDSAADTTTAAETFDPNDREAAVSNLDESLDFGGYTVRVGYPGYAPNITDIIGADDGDTVNTAVYRRNLEVEDFLNIKFEPIMIDENTSNAANLFATTVLAGDDVYDINIGHQSYLSGKLFDGLYTNLMNLEYTDYSMPWWNFDYMKEFTIGNDAVYFLFGDITLMMLKSAGAVYFNKPLYGQYLGDVDDFYTDTIDGKWTMDVMQKYVADSYNDLNGDGTVNSGDLYGMVATCVKNVEHFQYDAGIRTTKRDANDIPQLMLNNERTITFAEKLYNLYYNTPGVQIFTSDNAIDKEMITMFKSDELMFYPAWFYNADALRDMDSDYGIIPYPKLDENQEEYMTLVHNGTTTFTVPVTVPQDRLEMIGAVLEDMAFRAYKYMTPAYYEVAMKAKYSRDNVSSQLLDVIHDSMYTDFGYCYNAKLNSIGHLRPLAQSKTADFSSWYASKEAGALTALEELVELYQLG